jgi:transposase
MRPSGNPAVFEKRRSRAIQLLKNGWQPVDVACELNVDRRSVRRWNAAFRKNGIHALKSRHNTGRPSRLSEKEKQRLEQLLLAGAQHAGYHTDLWTCPRIQNVIKSHFGITYHVDHLSRFLRSLGWSPQKPERRAIERDEDRIRTWKRSTWPAIKKKPVLQNPQSSS